ncbi:MAG TPA: nucleotidyltransferase family protein [Candidatus Nitrosotalea sp.]|nr:nucleotidyltransferase family protein [Nitrososphaerota archaeon]HKU33265.1 nucleotidyltransferase family protein [Candidatus Nitrosotalea sp.]
MKAVVLAGGRGTRGRPFTDYIPKAMIPIHGKPLIAHIVKHLSSFKIIDEIIILADFSRLGKQIEKYFENHMEVKKPLRFVQDSQSGTGGDLAHIDKMLGKNSEFLLWFVDNLTPIDVKNMHQFHTQKNTLATIATRRYRKEETGYAMVENGIVTEFKEKPTIKLEMAECLGVYILDSKILKMIKSKKTRKELNLSYDILQPLSKKGKISSYDIGKTPWIDIDSPGRVEREKDLVNSIIKKL